jgi:hypothetical protein
LNSFAEPQWRRPELNALYTIPSRRTTLTVLGGVCSWRLDFKPAYHMCKTIKALLFEPVTVCKVERMKKHNFDAFQPVSLFGALHQPKGRSALPTLDTCRRSIGLDRDEGSRPCDRPQIPLDQHGPDGELILVGCAEVVVDPTSKPRTLPFLSPVITKSLIHLKAGLLLQVHQDTGDLPKKNPSYRTEDPVSKPRQWRSWK